MIRYRSSDSKSQDRDKPRIASTPISREVGVPTNNDFASATPIAELTQISGSTIGATVEGVEYPMAALLPYWYSQPTGPYNSVWYSWTATQTGVVFINLTSFGNTYSYVDVYVDGTVTNLVDPNYTNYSINGSTVNIPISATLGETYYIRISNPTGADFTTQVQTQSTTPPGNDDYEDATDIGSGGGTFNGSTDGSTVQTNEPDPKNGGLLSNLAGTVWHKYTATTDGFLAIWTSRSTPINDWYRVGFWEGTTATGSILVPPYAEKPTSTTTSWAAYYEVRAGKTYWIQVIRDVTQSFGDYTLHVNEYLETNEWSFPTDSFTSTTGGITIDGGTIRCTGSQAISDVIDVTPQYGTVDLGSDTKEFFRELRFSFQVRVLGGQILYREMWSGGDDTTNVPLSSDDHVNYTTRSLGLLRCRDTAGRTVMSVYLHDPDRKGENQLVVRTYMTNPSGYAQETRASVSLGTGRPQHDTGWMNVEILLQAMNSQGFDYTIPVDGQGYVQRVYGWVDSKPFSTYVQGAQYGSQIRYVDWGMFRHPSMVLNADQYRGEDNEAWTFEMRNMRVTNKVKLQPYDVAMVGDRGITQFDGFSAGTEWTVTSPQVAMSKTSSQPAIETMPTKTWKSIHSKKTGSVDERVTLTYNSQHGAGRIYALSLYIDTMPTTYPMIVARYGTANAYFVQTTSPTVAQEQPHGLAALLVDTDGELRIRPFSWKESCVAHLETGQHYFIEVHTDARFRADVKCTVYINGAQMGTYSSAYSWSEVAARTPQQAHVRWYTGNNWASWDFYQDLVFGVSQNIGAGSTAANPAHEIHFTNTIAARDPGTMLGPKQVVKMGAATVDGIGHDIPTEDETTDVFQMLDPNDQSVLRELYGWTYEVTSPGPWTLSTGENWPFPTIARYWFPLFKLLPASPMLRTSNDFTISGQSVPVSAVITGIIVHAPSGGSAQLIKGGSPVGSTLGDTGGVYGSDTEMWGTTWTPQEVNATDFGVRITGVTVTQLREVGIEVVFEDFGAPLNISRGGTQPAAGLFNVFGQAVASEFYFTGSGATVNAGGWWSGGDDGTGPRSGTMTSSGTSKQSYQTIPGMWAWQARGEKEPRVDVAGGSITVSDYRAIRDGLVVPRFAYSSNNGSSWTWIRDPFETGSAAYIATDAGATPSGNILFLDDCAHHDYFANHTGSWASGLLEDRQSATYVYRYRYRQFRYGNSGTSETDIDAINVYASCRSYAGRPNTGTSSSTGMWVMAESPDGNVKRVGVFTAAGSPSISRQMLSRAPGCVPWTTDRVSDLVVRVGSSPLAANGAIARYNVERGAALIGLHYELLVPADADPAPTSCGGLVTMHWKVLEERHLSERVTRR